MAANLPLSVITLLASKMMRDHHQNWHLVRRPDMLATLSALERKQLADAGWVAPRPIKAQGSGVDFLAMHRDMISQVNKALAAAADPAYSSVKGWVAIPEDPMDADWPVPPTWPGADSSFAAAKTPKSLTANLKNAKDQFANGAWLKTQTIDEVGIAIENSIHNWFHQRWSAEPWFGGYKGVPDPAQSEDDPRNDFLGSTYSSQVNETFWKLHGWIDDRITQWEMATGKKADLSKAWLGPMHMHPMAPMAAMTAPAGVAVPTGATRPTVQIRDLWKRIPPHLFFTNPATK